MKVRFYIEKRKGDNGELLTKQRPIFMTVAFHGKRVLITTKKNVDLRWWDLEKQRVRDGHPNAFVLNSWLNDYEKCANAVWMALASLSENPGTDEFKREFKRIKPKFSGGFFDVFFLFMEDGNTRWSAATYKKHRSFYKLLKAYELELGLTMSFSMLDERFLKKFVAYLKGLGYSTISIGKLVNLLVWYLNWATEKGYSIHKEYKVFYKALEREDYVRKKVLFLHWDELMSINNLSLEDTKQERVRDLFCLMCFTGVNYGELLSLKKEDVEAERLLLRGSSKKPRYVPLNKYSSSIFQKYAMRYYKGNTALPVMSVVTMNKYLSIILKKAKVDRMVSSATNSDALEALYLQARVSIATQTFIANALRLDIPSSLISAYTGVRRDIRVGIIKQELAKTEMSKFNDI